MLLNHNRTLIAWYNKELWQYSYHTISVLTWINKAQLEGLTLHGSWWLYVIATFHCDKLYNKMTDLVASLANHHVMVLCTYFKIKDLYRLHTTQFQTCPIFIISISSYQDCVLLLQIYYSVTGVSHSMICITIKMHAWMLLVVHLVFILQHLLCIAPTAYSTPFSIVQQFSSKAGLNINKIDKVVFTGLTLGSNILSFDTHVSCCFSFTGTYQISNYCTLTHKSINAYTPQMYAANIFDHKFPLCACQVLLTS